LEQHVAILHLVEGFAIVMLCNVRPAPRKLAVTILREVKTLGRLIRELFLTFLSFSGETLALYCRHLLEHLFLARVKAYFTLLQLVPRSVLRSEEGNCFLP
jgi:hypothetical protein